MKLVVAITGASGVELGSKFVRYLPDHIETHLITSDNALVVDTFENSKTFFYSSDNIAASVASGSFRADATAIIPCSMNTLAKVACGISDNLPTRVAAVALKEQKKLLLAPREMPFSSIALENMQKLAALGVIIAPPVMGYYAGNSSVEEMEKFVIGKWYDALGIENELYQRWEG